MIKALILDFDGTIVDTETLEHQAFQQLAAGYGMQFPMEVWSTWVGTVGGRDRAFEYLIHRLDEGHVQGGPSYSLEDMHTVFLAIYHGLSLQQQVMSGVRELIAQGIHMHLKLGIASSSTDDWVTSHLKQHDLFTHFDHIQTRDGVKHVKPAPDIYLAALQKLGVEPYEAIAIEDSRVGSLAAKAAGMYCVVIPNEVTLQQNFDHVDLVLPTLSGVELSDLIRRFGYND